MSGVRAKSTYHMVKHLDTWLWGKTRKCLPYTQNMGNVRTHSLATKGCLWWCCTDSGRKIPSRMASVQLVYLHAAWLQAELRHLGKEILLWDSPWASGGRIRPRWRQGSSGVWCQVKGEETGVSKTWSHNIYTGTFYCSQINCARDMWYKRSHWVRHDGRGGFENALDTDRKQSFTAVLDSFSAQWESSTKAF